MRAVNLLPREETRQRRQLALTPQNTPAVVGAGLGVLMAGALALGYVHESGAVASARQDLEQKKVELANTPKPPPPTAVQVDPNAQLTAEQSARMTAVTTALSARFAWDRVLREFAQVLPDDVWLTSLTFQTPTASTAAASSTTSAPTGITIIGTTYSHNSVARLLARLALIPELSNVTLQSDSAGGAGSSSDSSSSTSAPPATGGPGTVAFTITAAVNLPPGATSLAPAPPAPPPAPTTTDSTGASS